MSVVSTKRMGPGDTPTINTTGVKLLVLAAAEVFAGPNTPTDDQGNTYTPLTLRQSTDVNKFANVRFWYCINPNTSATHKFTISGTFSFVMVLGTTENVTAFDAENGNGIDAVGDINSNSITPGGNGYFVVTATASLNDSFTVSSPFTRQEHNNWSSGNYIGGGLGYYIQPTAGAISADWSSSNTSNPKAAAIASFVITAGSADATVTGVVAAASSVGLAPAPHAGSNVTGVASAASAAALAPTLSAAANVADAVALATGAGVNPIISASSVVAGVTTNASAAAGDPALVASSDVAGALAIALADAQVPSVDAAASGEVTAVLATASAAAQVPSLQASSVIAGIATQATAGTGTPSLSASSNVTDAPAEASAACPTPTLAAGAGVSAVRCTATAMANPPTLSWSSAIACVRAIATALCPAPIFGLVILALDAARTRFIEAEERVSYVPSEDRTLIVTR